MEPRQFYQLVKTSQSAANRSMFAMIFAGLALACVVGFKLWDEYRIRKFIGDVSTSMSAAGENLRQRDQARRAAEAEQREVMERLRQ